MDFAQILQKLPFALMFFLPAWALLFAPEGGVEQTAQRLLADIAVVPPDRLSTVGGIGDGTQDMAAATDQPYHVARQATAALVISVAAAIWYFLLQ